MSDAKRLLKALNEDADKFLNYKVELAKILKAPTPEKGVTRAILNKLLDSCGRCGGTGHYSFNPMSGTTCFQCNGNRNVRPKNKAGWERGLENARRFAASGELDKYLKTLEIRGKTAKLWDQWHKQWTSSGATGDKKYHWSKTIDWTNTLFGASHTNRDAKANQSLDNWSALPADQIEQIFLTYANGIYAIGSDVFTLIRTLAPLTRDLDTAKANEWFALTEKLRDYMFNVVDAQARSYVSKVPSLAKEAAAGKPFPVVTDRHGIITPLFMPKYVKLVDIKKSKWFALSKELFPKLVTSAQEYQLTWDWEKKRS